jgi:hypothetical protein
MKNVLLSLLLLLIILSCNSGSVAGNSSETGNCKIIGVANISENKPADNIPVILSKAGSKSYEITTAAETTFTSPTGEYAFNNIESGQWVITSSNEQQGFINQEINLKRGDSLYLSDTLSPTGFITINRISDLSTTLHVSILGTPFGSTLQPNDSSVTLSNIPSGADVILSLDNLNGETIFLDTVFVSPNDTVYSNMAHSILLIHGTDEDSLFTKFSEEFHSIGFLAESIHSQDLTRKDILNNSVLFFAGSADVADTLLDFIVTTSTPVINSVPSLFYGLEMISGDVEEKNWGISNDTRFNTGADYTHPILKELNINLGPGNSINVALSGGLSWGTVLASASKIGKLPEGNDESFVLFTYDRGDQLLHTVAPARRVGLFVNSGELTPYGKTLFNSSILWAAGLR